MSNVTIADRRAITSASNEADFRTLLRKDPRAGFARATGRAAPEGLSISVIEENAGAWEFVVPGTIEPDLPEPDDARGVIENGVYDILRDAPDARADALADPAAFLAEHLRFNIGGGKINVREEQAGEVLLVLPYADNRDELSETALDLVAGGMPQHKKNMDDIPMYDLPPDPASRAELAQKYRG